MMPVTVSPSCVSFTGPKFVTYSPVQSAWTQDTASSGTFEFFVDYVSRGSAGVNTGLADFERQQILMLGVRSITNPDVVDATSTVTLTLDEARYSDSALASNQFLQAVPEPSTLLLGLAGAMGLTLLRRRR